MKRTIALALLFASPLAFAGGGTVVKLQGTATVDRDGKRTPIVESSPVYTGDALEVPAASVAQVRFEDDSVFVIPGATRLRVDEFRMPTRRSGGKAVYTLESGGLRTHTGSVSKAGKDLYEMRTEEAMITVLGSAYTALRCQGSCARRFKAGLYVRVEAGAVAVTNAEGQMKLRKGQTVFVAAGAAPVVVTVSPLNDPEIAAAFGAFAEFDTIVHPPRLEADSPASPS